MSKSRSGASKRMAAGLLAGSLAVFGLALASPAGAVADVDVERLAGATRYGTAAAIAGEDPPGAFTGADTAILATGENFPDALAASGLAGSEAPAPILLTRSAELSPEALAALDELGVANVTIVGGTAAVSSGVQDTLEDEGYTVSRVAGTNRYGTAAEIAGEVGAPGDGTVLIATGTNYPDALAGGPLSYAGGHPILLVTPTDIPAETEAALEGATNAIILGGTAAVSNEVQAEIDDITGGDSTRLAGVNRFETAEAVADFLLANEAGFDGKEILLASGQNFPDALAGGPLGGEIGAPIILTGPACESDDWITDHSDTIEMIWALGGTAAQTDETLAACEAAAEDTTGGAANGTATTRPELVSVTQQLLQTTNTATIAKPAGLYLIYTFDEAVTGAGTNPAKFKIYQGDGTPVTATSATIQTDGKSVVAYFAAYDTQAEVNLLTVATVDDDAVRGASGAATDANSEGDSPLAGGTSSTPAAAGVTSAPDLISAGNFRTAASADVTAVDLTFDEAAFVQNTAGFHLETTTGLQITCTGPGEDTTNASGGTIPGGEGTTVITVTCPDGTESTFSATTISRAWVDNGAVDDTDAAAAPTTPTESVDVANGGNSDAPDLTLVVFSPDALAGFDTVGFLFDEAIDAAVTSAGFGIYDSTGAQNNAGGCSRSTESNSAVICLFADDTLKNATFVGGNVAANSVDEADGTKLNGGDEVGTTPSAGTVATSGKTDGPDLTNVDTTAVTSPFGTTTYLVKYTFDEDTADTASADAAQSGEEVVPALLHLILPDGIRLDCASVAGSPVVTGTQTLTDRTEDNDNAVTCTAFVVAGTATAATAAQVHSAVVGTVDAGAVDDEATTGATDDQNPEGAELATGSSGTPAS